MPAASVLPYSYEALCELFAEHSSNSLAVVKRKIQTEYFRGYFEELKAQTIVVETDYVDHDFLEDFAAYYVRCFATYSRYCTRIHFFGKPFDQDRFEGLFHADAEVQELLRQSYLGFIVVRPVPERIIGRTCLATYSTAPSSERRFPTTRTCEASLFGLALQLPTIAFQEQDRAVSACATSALWSVFQGTGVRFHHRILSPAEITHRANARNPLDGRAFPASDGLMFIQMADAVRSCELEPLWLAYTEPFFLRAAIHAYLSAGIPLLLNGDIVDSNSLNAGGDSNDSGTVKGVHGVAIVGYRVSSDPPACEEDGFMLWSSRVTKLYCRDDGVGPFARMEFLPSGDSSRALLSTSQADTIENIGSWRFVPDAVLVPLYHKIRVPFLRIYQEVRAFDNYLAELARQLECERENGVMEPEVFPSIEWDIKLTTVNDYKRELLNHPAIVDRKGILETGLPKYLWLARGLHRDDRGLDLVFDATGLELSNLCLRVVEFGSPTIQLLRRLHRKAPLSYEGCQGILQTVPVG